MRRPRDDREHFAFMNIEADVDAGGARAEAPD
jgi:hypothetical protein